MSQRDEWARNEAVPLLTAATESHGITLYPERGGSRSHWAPPFFSQSKIPVSILGQEGVICFLGIICLPESRALKSLIPKGHFNSRGRLVHLLLNWGSRHRAPDGCADCISGVSLV